MKVNIICRAQIEIQICKIYNRKINGHEFLGGLRSNICFIFCWFSLTLEGWRRHVAVEGKGSLSESLKLLITKVFVEQLLALPGVFN